ncbi:hypothetical protein DCO58_11735 [Helicobacter saguini]|uniref:Uncharacterized protein n=1 Tax=Helicobacter saguini TaxID=1548018 RepID=A0A347VQ83_9HELI|nr:hypothetical protein [Helicobacter saguini]MWV61039.1 hypothetical protein [Helicobacter saguini]MWV68292.1 hypothetical protein [Helicobacter saguini]MWV70243.1 hypothetical protein [Helicobacter saguini]MWV72146.1 hypothetical protein [Helicobacter saguini]TLD95208.1 hypothetical protein LS64_002255 [Helicobacter saguini]
MKIFDNKYIVSQKIFKDKQKAYEYANYLMQKYAESIIVLECISCLGIIIYTQIKCVEYYCGGGYKIKGNVK